MKTIYYHEYLRPGYLKKAQDLLEAAREAAFSAIRKSVRRHGRTTLFEGTYEESHYGESPVAVSEPRHTVILSQARPEGVPVKTDLRGPGELFDDGVRAIVRVAEKNGVLTFCDSRGRLVDPCSVGAADAIALAEAVKDELTRRRTKKSNQ